MLILVKVLESFCNLSWFCCFKYVYIVFILISVLVILLHQVKHQVKMKMLTRKLAELK